MLIVFSGLPASGKSTISRLVAQDLRAVYIRVDTIEQTLRDTGFQEVQHEGYKIAYAMAADNLALGKIVVADSVNPIGITRKAWRAVGHSAKIETICSDRQRHKERVETRVVDIDHLVLPTWDEILARDYEPWTQPDILIDTASEAPQQSSDKVLAIIRSRINTQGISDSF